MRRILGTLTLTLVLVAGGAGAAHAAIVAQPTRSLDAVEGDEVPRDRILVFEDAGACAENAYVITIRWGDGGTSPGDINFAVEDLGTGGCGYGAFGEHVYARPGTYPISATICRAAECVDTAGGSAFVGSVSVTGEALAQTAVAGQTLTAPLLAQFRDDNRLAQASQYTAVVDWGDGTTSPGVLSGADGRFEVAGQHVYAAAGTYLLRVTLLEGGVVAAVSTPGTVTVAPGAGPAPGAVVQTAQSQRGPAATPPSLRMLSRSLRRRSLRRGLAVAARLPEATRALRVTVTRAGANPRQLGTVTVRVRGGQVSGGVRRVTLRLRLSPGLRRRMRTGAYSLRCTITGAGSATTQFSVRR